MIAQIMLSEQALQGATSYTWSAPAIGGVSGKIGFRITADSTGKVIEIACPSPDKRYHTADGLGVGTREQAVFTRLGPPSRTATSGNEKYDIYDALGILYLIELFEQGHGELDLGLLTGALT